MKKSILLLVLPAIMLTSCGKDDSETPGGSTNNDNNTSLGNMPSTFSQKVLIEAFTGAGQSQSTDGFVKMDNILNANPDKAIPVCIHFADAMEIAQYTTLTNEFSNGNPMTIPSAMLNRTPSLSYTILNRTQWQSNFDVAKVKPAKCGLAIESSVSGSNATIIVHAGFNQSLAGDYTVTTYLVEDNVSGTGNMYDQRNAYNSTSGHPYYGAGDPIVNFSHKNVLRKVLSAPLGDDINPSALKAGGKEIKTYTTPINGYKANDLKVVAFITKRGSDALTYEVMNVQSVKLGNTKIWD